MPNAVVYVCVCVCVCIVQAIICLCVCLDYTGMGLGAIVDKGVCVCKMLAQADTPLSAL